MTQLQNCLEEDTIAARTFYQELLVNSSISPPPFFPIPSNIKAN